MEGERVVVRSSRVTMLAASMKSPRFFSGPSHIDSCLGLREERPGTQPDLSRKILQAMGGPPAEGNKKRDGAVPIPAHQHWFPVGRDRIQKRQTRERGKSEQMLCEGMFTAAHNTHPGTSRNA